MPIKLRKIVINLTLWIIGFFRKIKKTLSSSFLFFGKALLNFNQIFFKRLLLPIYKIYFLIKKQIFLIWHRLPHPSESKIFSFLTHRQLTHIFILSITFLIVINNFQTETEQGQLSIKTILNELNNQEEEVITEGPLLTKQKNYFFERATLKPQPYLEKEILEREIPPSTALGETALIKPIIPTTTQTPKPRKEIEYYLVQSGDVIGTIAEKFNLRINTILWANNLSFHSIIKPDQKLIILPVDGLLHRVKTKETLEKIAKKYRVDTKEIVKINKLALMSQLEVGKDLIIPGAEKITPPIRQAKQGILRRILQPRLAGGKQGHRFPWGYCTWYVAQKRYVPWGGHAKHWIANARKYGYSVGNSPVVGTIMVTKESWWGHVSYVEAVERGRVTISEMNHYGRGIVSRRTFKTSDWRIIGYIY